MFLKTLMVGLGFIFLVDDDVCRGGTQRLGAFVICQMNQPCMSTLLNLILLCFVLILFSGMVRLYYWKYELYLNRDFDQGKEIPSTVAQIFSCEKQLRMTGISGRFFLFSSKNLRAVLSIS